jgi:hypothetical protein
MWCLKKYGEKGDDNRVCGTAGGRTTTKMKQQATTDHTGGPTPTAAISCTGVYAPGRQYLNIREQTKNSWKK